MTASRLPLLAALLSPIFVLTAACSFGDDDAAGESSGDLAPSFAGNDDQCPSTTLVNEPTDEAALALSVDCFFAEYEAGRAVVWDLDKPTVEGDSILHRFAYDGTTVTIIVDNRLDSYGSSAVDARTCAGVERTASIPEGVDCTAIEHPGFPRAD